MESEDVGMDQMRKQLNVVQELLISFYFGNLEDVFRTKFIVFVSEHIVVEVIIQQSDDESPIFVICHPASIVTFRNQILQGREGDFVIFIKEHLQLSH